MTRYLNLAEFWYLADHVTGIHAATLIKASRVDLADSALHAAQAGFDETDFYPDLHDKAAVLARRIAWNHPLPDGNKRAAWACPFSSSISTRDHGATSNPTPTRPLKPCSPWPDTDLEHDDVLATLECAALVIRTRSSAPIPAA